MVRPVKLFLLLIVLLILLAAPSFFVPINGYKLWGYSFKYPSVVDLFDFDTTSTKSLFILDPEIARLDLLIDSISLIVSEDTLPHGNDTVVYEPNDTLNIIPNVQETTTYLSADILRSRLIKIEFPDSNHSALAPFFESLAQNLPSKQLIRVLHFGDSQIEGDRISSYLRSRFQNQFGGRGVGLLHAVPHSYQPYSVRQSNSSNWEKILLPDMPKGGVGNKFGILGGYSVFSTKKLFAKGGFGEAWIKFQRVGVKGSTGKSFTKCKVYYGYNTEPFLLALKLGDKTAEAEMIAPSAKVNQLKLDVPAVENTFQLDFKGDASPMIYGISLESSTGIVLDNIPIRGSSGTDFTRSDDATLKQFMELLNVKLVILQFGVNIVPNVVNSYKYYENQLYNQIVVLKKLNPGTSVILIGVSDMSRKEGNKYVSYPNLTKIRDAQRNAAFRAGAAFWDCYKAMGGENSMSAWVFANPPLASKDFIHFSLRGSRLVAEMFYSSLINEYEAYLNTKASIKSKSVNENKIESQ